MSNQHPNKKGRFIAIFFIIIIIPAIWFLFLNKDSDLDEASKKLTGKWLRSDGNYTIEIKEIQKENKMVSFYFNPNPINVAIGRWSMEDDNLGVYIEMNDLNYKGSNYKLTYNDETDQLIGFYYQAVAKQNFDVVFSRR